jgi:hypothetical protein
MTYEWLVRFLFQLLNKPAAINANAFSLQFEYIVTGRDYYPRASFPTCSFPETRYLDHKFNLAVAQYYHIPVINMRHVLLSHILEHKNLVRESFHAKEPYPLELSDDMRGAFQNSYPTNAYWLD